MKKLNSNAVYFAQSLLTLGAVAMFSGCSSANDGATGQGKNTEGGASALKCKTLLDSQGQTVKETKLEIFLPTLSVAREERKKWGAVQPLGFRGRISSDTSLRNSESSFPDMKTKDESNGITTITFAEKKCKGLCGNELVLAKNSVDENEYLEIQSVVIDSIKKTLTINPLYKLTTTLKKVKSSPLTFGNCDMNDLDWQRFTYFEVE